MNSQNILYNSENIDLKLDNSENYDLMLNHSDDYYKEILNFETFNDFNSLKINESLIDTQPFLFSIKLNEIDYSNYDSNYKYSGLTVTINYTNFLNNFNTTNVSYRNIILNSHIYTFTGITNEVHYFKIDSYNKSINLPIIMGNNESNILSKFSKNIIECIEDLYNEPCCDTILKLNNKPRLYKIGACDNLVSRRELNGWTLDFIFNRNNLDWQYGGVFYHIGVRGEITNNNLGDNDMSFGFTNNGEIFYYKTHYSGVTNAIDGYIGEPYIVSGKTNQLCVSNPTKDFKITIVFKRYYEFDLNSVNNNGGPNDLIVNCQVDNVFETISGATPNYTHEENYNSKWSKNKNYRLGDLLIYLNDVLISKFENFEETVCIDKGVQPFIQSWGGGAYILPLSAYRVSYFTIKNIKYYNKPLLSTEIKHSFYYESQFYYFDSCKEICNDIL